MGISSLAVRRGVTFAMLYIIIVGFGGFSLLQLKLDLFPDIKFPIIAIINSYSGVSPEEMETLVTRPMEMAISSVKNVKKISSTSKFGNAVVMVELEWGTDIDKAMLDIREKLDLFKKRLPEEARQPLLFAFDPSLQPILILSVTGSGNPIKLREYIEQRITPMFERVEGVASARIDGGKKRDIQILVDPLKLQLLGIPLIPDPPNIHRYRSPRLLRRIRRPHHNLLPHDRIPLLDTVPAYIKHPPYLHRA